MLSSRNRVHVSDISVVEESTPETLPLIVCSIPVSLLSQLANNVDVSGLLEYDAVGERVLHSDSKDSNVFILRVWQSETLLNRLALKKYP